MIKFILKLFSDLIKIYSPTGKIGSGFAFIVHPRDYRDITSNLPFLKIIPKNLVLKFFPLLWPFTVSKITGLKSIHDGKELDGWVIGVPMLAHEMMEKRNRAKRKIARAIKLAETLGARVIGLGALTGSIMEGGAGLSKNGNVITTAGRAYTTYTVKSYIEDAIKKFKLSKEKMTIVVIGAAGGVGSAITNLLIKEPYKKIILVDLEKKLEKVNKIIQNLNLKNIEITHQVGSARNADLIVTVTNAPEAVIESDDVKPGAIIIDDAQPSDISQEIINNRNDIILIEAGVIIAPSIKVGANFRLANKNETYCCLGEVMAIAASGWDGQYKPNDITIDVIHQISQIAKKLGFKLAPYQAFGKMVEEQQINTVKNIISKNNSA